jgi:alkanesulfonate monooxygenase SsuD/methylene tetrahydromethanopterin reductase-like flavin-dependent oxidoreductase (luciferase family)
MSTPPAVPKVGVLLPTREMAITNNYSVGPLLDFAQHAESLGFDSVWAGDSLVARPRLDPVVVLAAVAGVTSRITIGTAALTGALRHPLIGANMLASLDQASGGRLVLALGSGFPIPETADEFAAVGVPFAGRAARLDETVRLWSTAWRARDSGETSFAGTYWQVDGLDRLPPPATAGGPPRWLAGSDTSRVTSRVAHLYDGWMPFLPSPEAYGEAWQRIRRSARDAGRQPDSITPSLYATINVNPSRDRARAELESYVQSYYGRSLDVMTTVQAYGYGTAEQCAEWLDGYVRAGARHLVLRIGSLDPASQLKEVAATVLPAVRVARPVRGRRSR